MQITGAHAFQKGTKDYIKSMYICYFQEEAFGSIIVHMPTFVDEISIYPVAASGAAIADGGKRALNDELCKELCVEVKWNFIACKEK